MRSSLPYSLATVAWIVNMVTARIRTQDAFSSATAVIAVYGLVSVCITGLLRRRSPRAGILVGYGLWLPLAYLTACYDYHSVVPRVLLFLAMAWSAMIDAARHRLCVGPFLAISMLPSIVSVTDAVWPRPRPAVILEKHPSRVWQSDSLLGYRPLADTTASITCWRDGRRMYGVTYTFDEFARRWTPDDPGDAHIRHAIVAGNSCVFGENVSDEETLPARIAASTRGVAVHNCGFIGWGPQHLLALLESHELAQTVPQRQGLMLYGCFAEHVLRVNGSYVPMAWGEGFPRYVMRNGVPAYRGSFLESGPRRIAWFRFLRSSPSLDFVARRMDRLTALRPKSWTVLAAVLKACADEYHRQFDGTFVVFLWPFGEPAPAAVEVSLEAHGIPVVDLRALGVPPPRPDQLVPFDPHPSGAYYAAVAAELLKALANRVPLLEPSKDHAIRGPIRAGSEPPHRHAT